MVAAAGESFKMLWNLWRAVVASASVVVLFGASARADGPDARRDWNGLYLGLHAGSALIDADWKGPAAVFGVNTFTVHPDGWLFGGHVGYNFQIGPWVFGPELSYSHSTNLRDTAVGPVAALPTDSFDTKIRDLFTATARIGYAMNSWMAYARGGYANSEVTLSGLSGPPAAGVTFNTSERNGGWTIGAGAEVKLTRNVLLGFEYNFVRLENSFATKTGGTFPNIPLHMDLDSDIHTMTGRLSILLN
jgi:outer membrane immunogenic protein